MDTKEGLIRSEMQSLRSAGFQLCQTGIALCVGVEIALVFIRTHSYERLASVDQTLGYVPWGRFLLGTIFLAIIAGVFTGLTLFVRDRYKFYSDLLGRQTETGAPAPPPAKMATLGIFAVFFTFPIADLLLRAFFGVFTGAR